MREKTRKRRSSILKESNDQTRDMANVTFPIRKKRVSWAPDAIRFFEIDGNTPEGCIDPEERKGPTFHSVAGTSSFIEAVEEESSPFKIQQENQMTSGTGMENDNNSSVLMNLTCVDPNDNTLTDECNESTETVIKAASGPSAGDVTVFDNSAMDMTCVQDMDPKYEHSFLEDISDCSHVEEQASDRRDSFDDSGSSINPSESKLKNAATISHGPVLAPSLYGDEKNINKTTYTEKSMDETNLLSNSWKHKLSRSDDNYFTLDVKETGNECRKSFGDATTYSCIAMNETAVMGESFNNKERMTESGDADELDYLKTVIGDMEVDAHPEDCKRAAQGREHQSEIEPVDLSANSSASEQEPIMKLSSVPTRSSVQDLSRMESIMEQVNTKSPAKTPICREISHSPKTPIQIEISESVNIQRCIESPANISVCKEASGSSKTPAPIKISESVNEPSHIESPVKTQVYKEALDSSKTLVAMEISKSVNEPSRIESPAKTQVCKEALDSSKTPVAMEISESVNEPSCIESPAKTQVCKEALDSSPAPMVQELSHMETSVVELVNIESPVKTQIFREISHSSKTPAEMKASESVNEPAHIQSPEKIQVHKEISGTPATPSHIKSPVDIELSTSKLGQTNENSTSIQSKREIMNSPLSMSAFNLSCSDLMTQSFGCSMNEDASEQSISKVDVDTFFGIIAAELSSFVTNWDENLVEDLIIDAEKSIENPLETKVFKQGSTFLLEDINKMKLELAALKERFNENNPDFVKEYRLSQTDEAKQKLNEIISVGKNKTKVYMKQIDEKLQKLCSSIVNKELYALIKPAVDEMESALPNLHSLCDHLMKKINNERKGVEERTKKIWGNQTPPSKDELEKAFHLLTCIESSRKDNAELKGNEEQWNYLMKRQKRILDESNQFCTLMKNEEKYRKHILANANHSGYQLCDVVNKSRTKWVHSYMKNTLVFTAAFDQENPSIVTEYSLTSNIKDNYSVPECDIKLYELAHEIVKFKMDFNAPPSYPVSLREKLMVSTQVEVNVSRAIELIESIIESSYDYLGKIKLSWKDNDVVEARIKGSNIYKRLIIQFIFVERRENGQVKSANFLPVSFKILQNNTDVSESFISDLLKEASSTDHPNPTLFRKLILNKLRLECVKSSGAE